MPVEASSSNDKIAAYLENLTHLTHEVLNKAPDHNSPQGLKVRHHIAPDYVAYFDDLSRPLTFESCNTIWCERAKREPHLEIQTTSVSADVDSVKGTATVYTTIIMKGWGWYDANEAPVTAFGELSWRLDPDGEWRIWRYQSIRGSEV